MEGAEGGEVGRAEAGHGALHGLEGLALHGAGLGVEFVGIADEALQGGLGEEGGNADAGVALGHARGPLGGALAPQKFRAQGAMVDVGFRAPALYFGRGGEEDANVVEHRGGAHLLRVKLRGPRGAQLLGQEGHGAGMAHINIPEAGAFGIIFVNNPLVVHQMSRTVFQP